MRKVKSTKEPFNPVVLKQVPLGSLREEIFNSWGEIFSREELGEDKLRMKKTYVFVICLFNT